MRSSLLRGGLVGRNLLPLSTILLAVSPKINLEFTAIVVLDAIGVNLLYAFGRRKFTDIEKMRRYNAEMKAFREEMSAATKAGDKVKLERLKKKQTQMNKMNAEMMTENMKPTLLFFIPLLALYYLLSGFIGTKSVLAVTPIYIPLIIASIGTSSTNLGLSFFIWYMICSFTFSGIISRLFGLAMD